ncbi:MAG: 3'-5' exonuclease [Atribacterota bacterium]|jgi:DNA polymerase-3 subunit epsilon|nr:3'-5' exonuclease [Atribacterota bacterium]
MNTYAIIDFETTGLSPAKGDCPTEVAIVLVSDGVIVDRYQSLMNGGVHLSPRIQQITGITNTMVASAPPLNQVMDEAYSFARNYPLVAHNASFDRKFWDDAMARIGKLRRQDFICTLALARKHYPSAPNHKLETLARMLNLPTSGNFHRALADAEVTAYLFLKMKY